MSKRNRRKHSDEFKREAVKLVTEQGDPVAEAARDLGIYANLLRTWKQKFAAEEERMELAQLRAENKRLRMEREILKKVAPGKVRERGICHDMI